MLDGKTILITGGTGSFGNVFTSRLLRDATPHKVIIYSRDEYKQYEMRKRFPDHERTLRFFLGDVRDRDRLVRAFDGVDLVVHAAALKQVPALEYNPTEAVQTNVVGADNIVNAALDARVAKVVALSTDKAVNPVNLYGATKLVAEKIFVAGNAYGGGRTRFCCVRYGNVLGSRGSVIPAFLALKREGVREFPITDERMTRFWITLEGAVDLVMTSLREGLGGEVFVPRIPSMRVTDLAKAVDPDCTFRFTGIRPGEKLHETLVSFDEARHTKCLEDVYVIEPQFLELEDVRAKYEACETVPEGYEFRSDTNDRWLTREQLAGLIEDQTRA